MNPTQLLLYFDEIYDENYFMPHFMAGIVLCQSYLQLSKNQEMTLT